MKIDRPKIKVPLETIDIIIELVSISLLLLTWAYAISQYASLPETIPTHFNASGEADGFGSRLTIWLMPAIATVMYFGMFILNKFPHLHNYMVNITEENALKNYRFSTRVLRIVNFLCVLLFCYITYHIIEGGKGETLSLGDYFLPIVIGVSVVLPIVLFIYMRKLNK